MTQEVLGGESTHIHQQNWMEGVKCHFALQDSLLLPNLVIRMLFHVFVTWTFSYAFFFAFSCPSHSAHSLVHLVLQPKQWSKCSV